MRIGLLYALGPASFAAGDTYDRALAEIEEADRLGLDSVLFEEHHDTRGCPAVGSLVTAAAARTSSIRVGSADRRLHLEYPIHSAEDFAVADIISRGRAIFGVAPGDDAEEFRRAGVDFDTRDQHFREAVELVRTAWTQDAFQFVGQRVQFPLGASGDPGWRRQPFTPPYVDQWRRGQVIPQYLAMLPKPVQTPHPPIWVTARSRDTIEWAASRGLHYRCGPLETDDDVLTRIGWYAGALEAAGRHRNEVEIAVTRDVFLAENGERARELALPTLRPYLDAIRGGSADPGSAITEDLDEAALLDRCFLIGSPREVLDRLKVLQSDAGMTHLIARVYLPGRSHEDVLESIRLLASQVYTRLVA